MGDKLENKRKMRLGRRTQHPRPETSWETRPETRERRDQGGGRSTPAQMGDKLGDKSKTRVGRQTQHPRPETSWETRPETRARQDQGGGHSIPDQRQVGRQNRRQEQDETREADAAPQPRLETSWEIRARQDGLSMPDRRPRSWETRPETRARQDQGGGHSIPDRSKTRAGRRTQHQTSWETRAKRH